MINYTLFNLKLPNRFEAHYKHPTLGLKPNAGCL